MAKTKDKPGDPQNQLVCKNRRAFHDYHIGDRFEAGLVLTGTEVKSCREGKAHLNEAYVHIVGSEAFLVGAHIAEYTAGNRFNHETARSRKLLLHRKEIDKLTIKVRQKGFTLVPLSLYFKNGYAKLEIALAKGQVHRDQRQRLKERSADREIQRALKHSKR